MSFIDAEILKDVVGSHAAGPAGFGISYEVENGAHIDAGGGAVEVKLDEQSLARARAQNEGGVNKEVAKTLAPKPSRSLNAIHGQQEKTDNRYQALFDKRNLSSIADRGLSPAYGGHRPDYRALAAKSPLLRIRQRHLLQLRKTFDEIAQYRKKTVAVHPENLPRRAQEKLIEVALNKGEKNTVLGSLPHAGKAVGYNPKEWNRWGHSLIGGSSAPGPV